ncbi:MAG: undecaprenyldiphospho-muramoylpentapeptide beta-N-acetylglucosaminyltransferase [Bacteroidales bacterium]|jgi:UDP-N-acetylglucosamine--N-acetylmuramyl-(pentapeptide) pyrophosphoryl-undecaprenol N-acetylglucosamine transferase|nr:undecaprenyldiphospho-muramoylpentapeptide beta-N-acetylglucosaminyltransferase [Bacteroidales bacterium]
MKNKQYKMIVSGGGTGGHIFPALSIANAFKTKFPDSEILFMGAEGRMEMEKVPTAGYKIIGLPIIGMPRKISIKIFKFVYYYFKSKKIALKIVKKFNPDIVVGVGGYASFPALNAASKLKIPYLIQEQNSYSGKSNNKLAKKASKICVAYNNMDKFFPKDKIVITGNPIRKDIFDFNLKKEEALSFFKLSSLKPIILIIGGSLGAKTINQSIAKNINLILENEYQIIWQTGKNYLNDAKKSIENINNLENIYINDFIYKMDLAYSIADIIISRAGASSISELCIIGKPTIFVPSPNVAEDHQTKNAMALVNVDAAIMVKDIEAIEILVPTAIDLIKNSEKCKILSENIKKLALPNSAEMIIEEIKKIINT